MFEQLFPLFQLALWAADDAGSGGGGDASAGQAGDGETSTGGGQVSGEASTGDDEPGDDQTFTQEDLNRVAGKTRREAVKQFVKELGLESADDLKAIIKAKQDAEALINRARVEIQRERDDAISEVRREFADLTIMAAGKVIDRTLDKKEHKELIDKVLEESTSDKKK